MSNDTQANETEELRARVDRLEYRLSIVAEVAEWAEMDAYFSQKRHGRYPEGVMSKPEEQRLVLGEVAVLGANWDVPTLTYVMDVRDDQEFSAPSFVECACHWSADVATDEEGRTLAEEHIAKAHERFAELWPDMTGPDREGDPA